MARKSSTVIEINGVNYRIPERPVVAVCVDGGDPAYFEQARRDGLIPNIARFMKSGFNGLADCVVPSFTNPNNISIFTGAPPAVHGISANYFLDPQSGQEVQMTEPKFIRCPTILGELSKVTTVAAVTAKDKLRRMLGKGMQFTNGSVNFSSEKADQCTLAENGIERVVELVGMPVPDVYSAELSLFVLEAGIKLLERDDRPSVMYLSLTDYIQHKHAPSTPVSNDFHNAIDHALARMADLGALIAITADHGMNDKSKPDGSPNVVFLQDELDQKFEAGSQKVILTLTDPYIVHHGALGGFVGVYCRSGTSVEEVMAFIKKLPGIEQVLDRVAACREFELPEDRQPDIAVISDAATVIGSSESYHDFSALQGYRLRSHGGVAEQKVPFILSEPLNKEYSARALSTALRNYQIFDYAINGTMD